MTKNALSNLGIYHAQKPFLKDKKSDNFITQDLRLLYYYHNRMDSYGIEEGIEWKLVQNEERTILMDAEDN